jgi:hypothetical protein
MPLQTRLVSIHDQEPPLDAKGAPMKHFRAFVVAALATGLVAAAGTALAAKPKPKTVVFKGTYAGHVTEKVDGDNIAGVTLGTGTGTAVGKGTITGNVTGTTANPPCSPLAGTGFITGPKGKLKVTILSTSRACAASADEQNNITVSGNAKVAGGTSLFKKAKGSIHFSGTYERTSGEFQIKLTGKFTY